MTRPKRGGGYGCSPPHHAGNLSLHPPTLKLRRAKRDELYEIPPPIASRMAEKTGGHCKQRDNKNENENTVRTKSFGAMLLGIFSANHENMLRTNSHRTQKKKKRRKGRLLSRPFRPLPLIRGSVLPNVTCKVQAPLQDAPFYILHFTFYTLPARWWAFCTHRYCFNLSLQFLSFPVSK